METGFRTGGWKGALAKAVRGMQLHRETGGYVSAYDIGAFYADLGDKDKAFEWLNIAYQERNYDLLGLKTDFRLDALRSDPRFPELVRKIGLP